MLTSSGEVKAIVLLLAVLAAILVGACIIYGAEHWSKHAPENKEDKDDDKIKVMTVFGTRPEA